MELKPGYKLSEVGVIPEPWDVCFIEDVAHVTTGSRNTQDRVDDGEYPFFVRSQTVERINTYSFDGEAVLTAGDGVGTGKVFHYINGKFDVHQRVYRISRFDERLNGYFFYLYFSTRFLNRIMQMTAKSSVDSVRMNMIARMPLPIPPTAAEQSAIVEVISDVDALVDALDRLITKKRDLKQATMQQLLTGRSRLPGFQDEWAPKRLGNHVRFLRKGTQSRAELVPDSAVRYLHYGDIHTVDQVRLDPRVVALPGITKQRAKPLDRLVDGDVVFVDASEDLDGVGKSVEMVGLSGMEVVSGQHTIPARFDKSVLADGFKAYLQFCPAFRSHVRKLAAGTKVFATTRAHIASVEICLPSVEEQTAIAAVLSEMDAESTALEALRSKTASLKQAMMQELLTGKTRLVPAGDAHA